MKETPCLRIFKAYMLPIAVLTGAAVFFLFEKVPFLYPYGDPLAAAVHAVLPYMIFAMLFFAFLKIKVSDMKLNFWHVFLAVLEVACCVAIALYLYFWWGEADHVIWQGMLACFAAPTAAAVSVVSAKLGGSVSKSTSYIMISNTATAVMVPLVFPLARGSLDFNFLPEFLEIAMSTFPMLILPLVVALLLKRFAPVFAQELTVKIRDLSFYIFCFTLTSVAGIAVAKIYNSDLGSAAMVNLCLVGMVSTAFHFALGKGVGHPAGYRITAGQCFGQKNMVFGIYIATAYLSNAGAIATGWYMLWQNVVNSYQIYHKVKLDRQCEMRGEKPYEET